MAGNTYKDTECFEEPTLEDLFAEPIIQLFMKRDGISPTDMRGQLHRIERDYELAAI